MALLSLPSPAPGARPDIRRKGRACQASCQGACGPAQEGQQPQSQKIGNRQRLRICHRQGKNLIGIKKGDQQPGQKADPLTHPLGQSQAHQAVAAVDDDLGHNHFPQASHGHDQGQPGKLPGTGQVHSGDQCGIQRPDPLGYRHGSKAKADGKISQPHRQPHPDPPPHFICIHSIISYDKVRFRNCIGRCVLQKSGGSPLPIRILFSGAGPCR